MAPHTSKLSLQLDVDLPEFIREGDIEYPFEDTDDLGDENKIRGNWSSRIDYLLSALGFTFGIGTLWRYIFIGNYFIYTCYYYYLFNYFF